MVVVSLELHWTAASTAVLSQGCISLFLLFFCCFFYGIQNKRGTEGLCFSCIWGMRVRRPVGWGCAGWGQELIPEDAAGRREVPSIQPRFLGTFSAPVGETELLPAVSVVRKKWDQTFPFWLGTWWGMGSFPFLSFLFSSPEIQFIFNPGLLQPSWHYCTAWVAYKGFHIEKFIGNN